MPKTKIRVQDVFSGRRSILDNSEYNEEMKRWALSVQRLAKQQVSAFHKGKRKAPRTYNSGPKAGKKEERLRTHIAFQMKSDAGEVAGIAFQFPVHGIFREYGVGRGHPRGNLSRSMSDWMSGVLTRQERKLMDIVAEHKADSVLKLFMGIKK